MDFRTFQSNCKYATYGLKQDTVRDFELTCRKPECVPQGHSWGVCDEEYCPYFGVKICGGNMIDAKTGKTLHTFGNEIIMEHKKCDQVLFGVDIVNLIEEKVEELAKEK